MQTLTRTLMLTLSAACLVTLGVVAAHAAPAPAITTSADPLGVDRDDPVERAVIQAFEAALADDFAAYQKLLHPSAASEGKRNEMAFKRFARQAAWYLANASDAASFEVERAQDLGSAKRLYLKDQKNPKRAPASIRLEKDGAVWKIAQNSL